MRISVLKISITLDVKKFVEDESEVLIDEDPQLQEGHLSTLEKARQAVSEWVECIGMIQKQGNWSVLLWIETKRRRKAIYFNGKQEIGFYIG